MQIRKGRSAVAFRRSRTFPQLIDITGFKHCKIKAPQFANQES